MGGNHRKEPGCTFAGIVIGALAFAWIVSMVAMINSF